MAGGGSRGDLEGNHTVSCRHPTLVPLLELRLEPLRTHSSRWLDGNRNLWLFKLLSGFGLTAADWLCLQLSSAPVLSQPLCPPAEVGSGRQQQSRHTCCVCPGLPLPEQQMELGFCPLEMMWDTESLFQHSHFSHLWWFEGCGCGGGEHAAAAAELLWFGPPQLCLSPAIRPVLAVPCLLIVLSALSPSLAQPPVPWEAAKSEI